MENLEWNVTRNVDVVVNLTSASACQGIVIVEEGGTESAVWVIILNAV
jgi:hypothetical protein